MAYILHYFTTVPIFSPLTILTILSGLSIPNTIKCMLLSLHKDVAVESITFKSLFSISRYDISSYLIAVLSSFGSAEYTPSIVLAKRITSASVSAALKAAAVSVVKNGFPRTTSEYNNSFLF